MASRTTAAGISTAISNYIDSTINYRFQEGEEVKLVEEGTHGTIEDRKTIVTMLQKLGETGERAKAASEVYDVKDSYGISRRVNGGDLERVR